MRSLAVTHPLPSALVAALVLALAMVAGAPPSTAIAMAVAMLGFQVSIGCLDDIIDAEQDRHDKPAKPIPAGLIDARSASFIAIAGGVLGLGVSATFGVGVLLLAALGYGCGVVYVTGAGQRTWGWICFSLAFPVLLAWTWQAAAGTLPPGWPLLLPLAALAGPTVQLANGLVDVETDTAAGTKTLAVRLGRRRGRRALVALSVAVFTLAWAMLVALRPVPPMALLVAAAASALAALGLVLSRREGPGPDDVRLRIAGWLLDAAGLALFAVAWALTVTAADRSGG